jgi:hypothetical protein
MLAIVALSIGVGVVAQPDPAPPEKAGIRTKVYRSNAESRPEAPADRTLAREQLNLARKALEDLNRLAGAGEARFSDTMFALWEQRQLDALRASGASKAEIIAELETDLAGLDKQLRDVKRLYETKKVARIDVMELQYRRNDMQMRLSQERAR